MYAAGRPRNMGQQRMGQSSIPGGIFGGAPSQQPQQRSGGTYGTSQSDAFLARLERVETDTRPTGAGGSEPITLQNWERKSKQIAARAATNEARNDAARSRAAGESARSRPRCLKQIQKGAVIVLMHERAQQ